jgi:UbiD family decarboxylase
MAYIDLREFISALESHGELQRVSKEICPEYELAGVCIKTIAERGPVLLFENVKDSRLPVLNNPFGSRQRVALALQCEEKDLLKVWMELADKRISPAIVKDGPGKEVKVGKLDVTRFPLPILWHEGNGGPYVMFAQFVCKDPRRAFAM